MKRRSKAALLSFVLLFFPASASAQDPTSTDMAKETSNRTLVADAFDRWSAGTGDVFSLLADDVVWRITGYDPAVAQTYRSRQALLDGAAIPLGARLSKPLKPAVRRIWADGDDVLVYWDGAAPFKDGSQYRNSYLWIMTVRERRIVAVTAFLDNAAFAAALAKPVAIPSNRRSPPSAGIAPTEAGEAGLGYKEGRSMLPPCTGPAKRM